MGDEAVIWEGQAFTSTGEQSTLTASYAPMRFRSHTEPGLGRKSRLWGSRNCSGEDVCTCY